MFLLILCFACIFDDISGLEVTWSNRLGKLLTPVSRDVWVAERPFVWNNIDVGGRSVIIRLSDQSLFVHSPIDLTPDLKNSLSKLGKVGHVVSPNYEHLKFARQWANEYPLARRYACPGLISRMPDVDWTLELGTTPESVLSKIFDIIHVDCEVNPLTSKPFFNEVIFYHKPSKSLLVTDLFWNYPSSSLPNYYGVEGTGELLEDVLPAVQVPLPSQAWKFLMDKIYLPIYKNVLIGSDSLRRKRYDAIVERILSLEIEAILPCHGDIIRGSTLCRRVLKDFFI